MTGHNYSEESNIFTAAAARSWYRQAAFPCSNIIISGGKAASRWWIVYSSCVNAKSTTYLYCHHGQCLISVPSHGPYRIVATRDSCFYGPKSIKTEQGWKCTGSTTTPLLQYIFAVQDLQHAVLYFLIFGAAGKLPSEASKSKWIMIISMSLYVWYKLKSVKFTWKTIHEYCN